MKDKTLKILLGIIATNLTIQTLKDTDLFSTVLNMTVMEVCSEPPGPFVFLRTV